MEQEQAITEADKHVPGAILIETVSEFIKRFLFLKEDSFYLLIALWIIATHTCKEFEYTGYLFAYSAEKGCGKSILLKLLYYLAYKATSPMVSLTEAVLFRTAGDGTQLIDEMDSAKDTDVFRSVLNAGFERTAQVPRMEGRGTVYVTKYHPVFNPRAIAGIGHHILHDTTRDRCFRINLVRQTREEEREEFRSKDHEKEGKEIYAAIGSWADRNKSRISEIYSRGECPYLYDFSFRTRDISKPLAAICETAYEHSSQIHDARLRLTKAISITRDEKQNESNAELNVIRLLAAKARTTDPLVGMASELAMMCSDGTDKLDAKDVSRALRKYGFKTKSARGPGGPRDRYSVGSKELDEIIARYYSAPQLPATRNEEQGTTD